MIVKTSIKGNNILCDCCNKKYNEYVEVFIYYNGFGDLICNIVDIY